MYIEASHCDDAQARLQLVLDLLQLLAAPGMLQSPDLIAAVQ